MLVIPLDFKEKSINHLLWHSFFKSFGSVIRMWAFHLYSIMKIPPFFRWLCHSIMWLFHLHSTLKIRLFSPVFPLAESIAETFCWLSLWAFKEKSINHFYCTASRKVPFLSRPFCHFTYNYLNCWNYFFCGLKNNLIIPICYMY